MVSSLSPIGQVLERRAPSDQQEEMISSKAHQDLIWAEIQAFPLPSSPETFYYLAAFLICYYLGNLP